MINVAIDGPAGAGKSTVAKTVAQQLGLIYLDTGAMYRATAYTALNNGLDVTDEKQVSPMLDKLEMNIAYEDGVQQIYVNGVNTTPYLREHRMSKAASDISALPPVRYKMVELQRKFARSHDVVLDGRDIGTFVLPDANCKFFLTATPEERARRRYKELIEKGQTVEYDALLRDITQRDYNDSHRAVAPLKQAEDADYLDTTNMSIDEVVNYVVRRIEKKTGMGKAAETVDDAPNAQNAVTEAAEVTRSTPNTVADSVDPTGKAPGGNADASGSPNNVSKAKSKNAEKMKKYYQPLTKFGFYRFIRAILVPIQKILWPIKLINPENAIPGRAIYICNHYSKVDAFLPIVAIFKKEAHILAKVELFSNPISAGFMHGMGAIPVKRGEGDIEAVRCVLTLLKNDKQLLIFPEGTRNKHDTQQMAEIKTGTARFALKTNTTIVPMLYYSKPRLLRRNWLYIAEPFTLEQFYGDQNPDVRHAATEFIVEKLNETRRLLNEYVDKEKKSKRGKGVK